MIVYRSKEDLSRHLDSLRRENNSIGLVPTMGALHRGHASLVEKAARENDVVVVTIFVNPTQFNDPGDLENYPRTLDRDLDLLQKLESDLVFVPSVQEMYPEEDERIFDLDPLDKVMEGKHRKGHFNGVAQIVSKLFQLSLPHRAYFGQKDFQQLVIIRRLTALLKLDIQIVPCPIIREKDGLAMSSRNVRLSKHFRKKALVLNRMLHFANKTFESDDFEQMKGSATQQIEAAGLKPEYFELVDGKTLLPVSSLNDSNYIVALVAAWAGDIRLIDNMILKLEVDSEK